MFEYYKIHVSELILLAVTVALSVVFVFAGPAGMLKPFKKKK